MVDIEDEHIVKRWDSYRSAMDKFPHVREAEIELMLKYADPSIGEGIVECGTGNGILTFLIAERLKGEGSVKTFDVNEVNLDAVIEENKRRGLPISCYKQSDEYVLPLSDNSVDKVVSIATLHHHDNRTERTGYYGRQRIMNEFFRILKPEGKLIVADIAPGTISQKYFDEVVDNPENPAYCQPIGHPHDGISEDLARLICSKNGFDKISYEIRKVPWKFDDEEQAQSFLQKLHNAKGNPKEVFEEACKYLGLGREDDKLIMGWELFYLTAQKPSS